MQISLTFQENLIFINYFQVNRATYKIQMTSYFVEEGESVEDLNDGGGGREEGASAQSEPDGYRGSGWRGLEADAEEE
jgi:hypothetical protein